MNIKNMYYPVVDVVKKEVHDFNQEVKVENGRVYTIVINPNTGQSTWVEIGYLKTKHDANEKILERLLWALDDVKNDLNMSKAELKRRFIQYSLISK